MYHTEPLTDKTIREWYMNSSRVAACALRNEQAVWAVTAVAYPMSAGKFSNSHVPIPDWIDYGAGRFTHIHISLDAVRSSPRGPHQSEWRQTSLCKQSTLNVFCFSAEEDVSINRYNRIATP